MKSLTRSQQISMLNQFQHQYALKRKRIKSTLNETTKWLDLQNFVDCNARESDLLMADILMSKQHIELNALKVMEAAELSALQSALDRQRKIFRERSLRNAKLKLHNEAKNQQSWSSHSQIIEERTSKIQQLSRQLASIQDSQNRYRSVQYQSDFFSLYERLCRECQKLRKQNQILQTTATSSNI